MRALVTGATGFTGSHLARILREAGDEVRATVRSEARATAVPEGVTPVVADLADPASLDRAVVGIDIVYNIAALFRQPGLPDSVYRAVNAEGPARLVEAAARAGVKRVLHCSTVGVHGDIEHPPANEDAPLRPGDIYQHTKLDGEVLARDAAQRVGMPLTIVRPTGIYGPGDRRLFMLIGGVARRRFVVLGSGRILYHLTYVEDLARGMRQAALAPAAADRTYILSGPDVTTLNELVDITAQIAGVKPLPFHLPIWPFWYAGAACEAICRPFGISPPIYRRRIGFFVNSRAFDSSRARAEFGYNPVVGLREGIARTLAWYREQGWV